MQGRVSATVRRDALISRHSLLDKRSPFSHDVQHNFSQRARLPNLFVDNAYIPRKFNGNILASSSRFSNYWQRSLLLLRNCRSICACLANANAAFICYQNLPSPSYRCTSSLFAYRFSQLTLRFQRMQIILVSVLSPRSFLTTSP